MPAQESTEQKVGGTSRSRYITDLADQRPTTFYGGTMSDSTHQAVNDAMIEALTFVRSFLDHDRSKPFSVALSPEATAALGEALIQMFRAEARRRDITDEADIRAHVRDRINGAISAATLDALRYDTDG